MSNVLNVECSIQCTGAKGTDLHLYTFSIRGREHFTSQFLQSMLPQKWKRETYELEAFECCSLELYSVHP